MIKTHSRTHTRRKDQRPAQLPRTEGLDALDRERAASLADEGGSAGARLEQQIERTERIARANQEDEPLSRRRWIFVPFVLVLSSMAARPWISSVRASPLHTSGTELSERR